MKTVAELIEELRLYPKNAFVCTAPPIDGNGLLVYKPSFATYSVFDKRSDWHDDPIAFIKAAYDDSHRPSDEAVE